MAIDCFSEGTSFTVHVSMGEHHLTVDEPENLGGRHTGPSPFAVLAASVGACTAITVADAARERGLPLSQVRVRVRTKLNKVSRSPGDPDLWIKELRRSIEIDGELSPEDRDWLVERGAACPVSRSITAGIATPATTAVSAGSSEEA